MSDPAEDKSHSEELCILHEGASSATGELRAQPAGSSGSQKKSAASRKPRVPLVLKLTLSVAVTLFVLEAVLLATGHNYWREILQKQIRAHLNAVAVSRRELVEAEILLLRQRAAMNTERGEYRRFVRDSATGQPAEEDRINSVKRLRYLADGTSVYASRLVDKEGKVLLSSDPAEIGRSFAGDPGVEGGLAAPYLSPPRRAGDHFEAVLAAPIVNRNESIGVLLMTVDISVLSAPLRDITGLGESGEVMLLTREGDQIRSLFPPRYRTDVLSIPAAKAPDMAAMIGGGETFLTMRDYRGESVLAAGGPINYGGWSLVAKMDEREAYAPIDRALRMGVFYGSIVAAIGLAAAYLLARGLTRPVRRLAQAASRVAGGDYNLPVPVKSADELGALSASFNEMTAAIRARGNERDEAEAALRKADRRKDEFLAMLGHELRNPLSAVANAVLLWKESGNDAFVAGMARDIIERQTGHLKRLVDDLLDVARITSGKIELHKQPVDVCEMITNAVEAVRPLIKERRHTIHLSLTGGDGLFIDGDPMRLDQVVTNLVTNAAKYTPDGGRINVGAKREGNEAVITVSDNGIGIAPGVLAEIFDLFKQADRSLDRTSGGLGIGLNLCRQLVELHGGSISARSDGTGPGAEFTVRLPAVNKPEPVTAPPSAPIARAGRHRRILLADDHKDTVHPLSRLLTRCGHEVFTAYDGLDALKAAHEFQPDAFLLDIGLPGLDGYTLARRLREEGFAGTSMIAITGYAQENDRVLAREAGFDHHFSKPVDFEALAALLAEEPSPAATETVGASHANND